MIGVTSITLNSDCEYVTLLTAANTMGISTDSLQYIETITEDQVQADGATYTVAAVLQVQAQVAFSDYSDSDALYTGLTTYLSDAVTSGRFTAALQDNAGYLGTPELYAAIATKEEHTEEEVTYPPKDKENNAPTGGSIAAGVIAILTFFAMVGGFMYYTKKYPITKDINGTSSLSLAVSALGDQLMGRIKGLYSKVGSNFSSSEDDSAAVQNPVHGGSVGGGSVDGNGNGSVEMNSNTRGSR
jgi:hypothetical protein